jgi:AraC-like DNA-binding protein
MEVIFTGGIFSALIVAIVLLTTKTVYQQLANRILAGYYITIAYCGFLYVLVISDAIYAVPHFFKTAAPINFLPMPLCYLYVRSVLRDQNKLEKYDYLHFIPFALFIVSYLPFYPLSSEEKIGFIENAKQDPTITLGVVSEGVQFLMRELQALIYLILQWRILFRYINNPVNAQFRYHTNQVFGWLKAVTAINTLHFICIVFSAVCTVLFKHLPVGSYLASVSDGIFGLGFLAQTSYLLLNPSVLFGIDLRYTGMEPKGLSEKEDKGAKSTTGLAFEEDMNRLVLYFEQQKPYLQPGLTLSTVANAMNMTTRNISFLLNTMKGQGFNDFVNSHRVQEAIAHISSGYLLTYTVESLADKTGFSSVRSLNRAFAKHAQMSPSEYNDQSRNVFNA